MAGDSLESSTLSTWLLAAGGWWLRDGAWVFLGLEEEQVPSVAPSSAGGGAGDSTSAV